MKKEFQLTPSPSRARLLATHPHTAIPRATQGTCEPMLDIAIWSLRASPTNSITPDAVPPVTIQAPGIEVKIYYKFIGPQKALIVTNVRGMKQMYIPTS